LSELFANGRIVVLVLAFMLVESIALILVRKKMLRLQPLELIVSLGAGAALLMALRDALRAAPWTNIASWLVVALGCHLWDLKLRWATRRTG
jgi:hypothetical protein